MASRMMQFFFHAVCDVFGCIDSGKTRLAVGRFNLNICKFPESLILGGGAGRAKKCVREVANKGSSICQYLVKFAKHRTHSGPSWLTV